MKYERCDRCGKKGRKLKICVKGNKKEIWFECIYCKDEGRIGEADKNIEKLMLSYGFKSIK